MYTLKYIECHALGMSSFPPAFSDKNVKTIRKKMVTKMFEHDLCYHRNGDDADYTALDMYEGQ